MPKTPPPSSVRLGLLQMASGSEVKANMKKALAGIREAAAQGAQIICLQELFRSLYFPQKEEAHYFNGAEPIPGPTTELLSEAARKFKVVLVASLFEKRTEGIYHNTAAILDADGSLVGKYRKMHIPDDPGFFEKFYFTPGDLGFQTFQTHYAKIGVLICWDQWFPEAARLTALSGAQILIYPTAIGWLDREPAELREVQRSGWELIQRSHALANGVFVASVNRVGKEGKIQFWGSSFVANPLGQVIQKAALQKEEILIADCPLHQIRETREGWPFLRDRRIDAYEDLTSRFLDFDKVGARRRTASSAAKPRASLLRKES